MGDKRRCIVTMFDEDGTNPVVIIGDIISNDNRLCLGMRPDATNENGLLVGIGVDHASFAGRCRVSEYGDGKVTPLLDTKAIDGFFCMAVKPDGALLVGHAVERTSGAERLQGIYRCQISEYATARGE